MRSDLAFEIYSAYKRLMYLLPILIIAVLAFGLFAKRDTRDCRWRERRLDKHSEWTCLHCGAKVQGAVRAAPKSCQNR